MESGRAAGEKSRKADYFAACGDAGSFHGGVLTKSGKVKNLFQHPVESENGGENGKNCGKVGGKCEYSKYNTEFFTIMRLKDVEKRKNIVNAMPYFNYTFNTC